MTEYWQILIGFAVLAVAASRIGEFFKRYRLPLISGFLLAGIVVGPFVLNLLPAHAISKLQFIDQTALAVIAFAAGSEVYVKELRSRMKNIAWVTVGLVTCTFTLGSVGVFLLGDYIPFMQNMPPAARAAVAILAGAILVARSPSSAIAIVNELRAKGPFTQTALGVTVIMDAVVIMFFAVNTEIAHALFTDLSIHVGFLLLVLMELLLSFLFAFALAKVIQLLLSLTIPIQIKSLALLGIGFGIFEFSSWLREFSGEHLVFEILLEPLLICMIGSFLIANWSAYRNDLSAILERMGPPVYVAFFTLTGASLALDVLADVWPVALILFAIRLAGIFLGSFSGGILAGEPISYCRISWMAYITQAGVGLGLAKEVVAEFPDIGPGFAAVMISVIILNQLVGPPFFKLAIQMVGEAHDKAPTPQFDGIRDVVIFGLNARSLALAKQLTAHDWQVKIATAEEPESYVENKDFSIYHVDDWSLEEIKKLDLEHADSIVTVLKDDDSYRVCETIYEHFGIENMIVQLRERSNRDRFHELGVMIVEAETSVVTLMEQYVRSPAGTSLLLGMESGHDVVDVVLRNPNLHGMALRELRLPLDVLVLSIHRSGQSLITRGYTQLRLGDKLTMVGPENLLEEMILRFES